MLDQTDLEILSLLQADARMQHKAIGEAVHLTGQAVANRIARMQAEGILRGYTAVVDDAALGIGLTAYVTVFLKSNEHRGFQAFLRGQACVREAHRTSGEGCYMLKLQLHDNAELDAFLDCLTPYGNYRLATSVSRVK